ncbi:MAG: hypothetical protein U0169_26425 [Polyangiaceae bacterium]
MLELDGPVDADAADGALARDSSANDGATTSEPGISGTSDGASSDGTDDGAPADAATDRGAAIDGDAGGLDGDASGDVGTDAVSRTDAAADATSAEDSGNGTDARTGDDSGSDPDGANDDGGTTVDASDAGDSGDANASGTDGGTCSTDLSSDPRNCGACGHDCTTCPPTNGSASCVAGVCAPALLTAFSSRNVSEVYLNDQVYWVERSGNQSIVRRVPKTGATNVETVGAFDGDVHDLFGSRDAYLYYASTETDGTGGIHRFIGPGVVGPHPLFLAEASPPRRSGESLEVVGGTFYFVERQLTNTGAHVSSTVSSCSGSGCFDRATVTAIYSTASVMAGPVAVDASGLASGTVYGFEANGVRGYPFPTGAPFTLKSGVSTSIPNLLGAAFGSVFFWSTQGEGLVSSVAPALPLDSNARGPIVNLGNGDVVFGTLPSTPGAQRTIFRRAANGALTTVAVGSTVQSKAPLATDRTCVYWAAPDAIYRAPP